MGAVGIRIEKCIAKLNIIMFKITMEESINTQKVER